MDTKAIFENVEFFRHEQGLFVMIGGKTHPYEECPEEILAVMAEKLTRRPEAVKALNEMGLSSYAERVRKFIECNFSGFNGNSDLDDDETEFCECGNRGTCRWEGKLCARIKVSNGVLTPREIEIIKMVAEDLSDKEIAYRMTSEEAPEGISTWTVKKHRENIKRKLGVNLNAGMVVWAFRKGIIQ